MAVKRSDFDSYEDFVKAFKEERLKKKEIKKKRKWATYQRNRYRKLSKKKKKSKEKEKNKAEKEKQKEKELIYPYVIKERDFDFLKYRFVADKYFKQKFFKNISLQEFNILLFLYSEPPFTKAFFIEITRAITWNKKRLEDFIEKGYLKKYEQEHEMIDKRYSVRYDMTKDCRQKITKYYQALTLMYEMPTYGKEFQRSTQTYIEMKLYRLVNLFNDRLMEHHNSVALHEEDKDRFDIEQKSFREIYDEFLKTI